MAASSLLVAQSLRGLAWLAGLQDEVPLVWERWWKSLAAASAPYWWAWGLVPCWWVWGSLMWAEEL